MVLLFVLQQQQPQQQRYPVRRISSWRDRSPESVAWRRNFALLSLVVLLTLLFLARSIVRARLPTTTTTTIRRENESRRSDVLDDRSDVSGSGNGDTVGPQRRRRAMAYGRRRIPAYRRTATIGITVEPSSIPCGDLRKPVRCNPLEGYLACFRCIEAVATNVCAHVDRDVEIHASGGDETFTLKANRLRDEGYCVRESLARELSALVNERSDIARDRAQCSANNADWILARRVDATLEYRHNFVCHCKYPHLLANRAGPLSPCTRDVACNGHGRLDEESRAQRVDPFVDGRCLCEAGWIAEYDSANGGPYCREATFAEWPSALFANAATTASVDAAATTATIATTSANDGDGGSNSSSSSIDLYAEVIDASFREFITRRRKDDGVQVLLPNPCVAPCTLTSVSVAPAVTAWVCADGVDVERNEMYGSRIKRLGIAVTRDRDYFSGNGGRYPNACLVLDDAEIANGKTIALQYLSQDWQRLEPIGGEQFSQEVGFFLSIRKSKLARRLLRRTWISAAYKRFLATLRPPANPSFDSTAIVWTRTARGLDALRIALNYRLRDEFFWFVGHDPMYGDEKLAFDYPVVRRYFGVGRYYGAIKAGSGGMDYDEYQTVNRLVNRHITPLRCSAGRNPAFLGGGIVRDDEREHAVLREIDENEAKRMARGLVPICWSGERADGRAFPQIVAEHPNPTGCVIFTAGRVQYNGMLWYPRDMDMRRFARVSPP